MGAARGEQEQTEQCCKGCGHSPRKKKNERCLYSQRDEKGRVGGGSDGRGSAMEKGFAAEKQPAAELTDLLLVGASTSSPPHN